MCVECLECNVKLILSQYNDPEVVAKVKKATDDSIHLAFDGFASDESQVMTVEVLGPGAGHVVLTLPPAEKAQSLRPDVKMEGL